MNLVHFNLNIIDNFFLKYKDRNYILFGIGGSCLGAQTVINAISTTSNIQFIDFIDNELLMDVIKNGIKDNALFLFISKSGNTIETLVQMNLALKYNVNTNNIVCLTSNNEINNKIFELAKQNNIEVFDIASNISGRFSCFTNTCLIPSKLCNIDIQSFISGAQDYIQNTDFAKKITNLYCKNEIKTHVILPYSKKLESFSFWASQLWAESLGKNNLGFNVIPALGTRDQHSQLQLYLDGPKDKFITLLNVVNSENNEGDISISQIIKSDNHNKISIDNIINLELYSIVKMFEEKNIPCRLINITLNEYNLGKLMMEFMMEVIEIANIWQINPFNQDAVEKRKTILFEKLTSFK